LDRGSRSLLCACITTFTLCAIAGGPGDLVAVQGIGGLAFGRPVGQQIRIALLPSGGSGNGDLAKKLGAHIYIDSRTVMPLRNSKTGRRKIILPRAKFQIHVDLFPDRPQR